MSDQHAPGGPVPTPERNSPLAVAGLITGVIGVIPCSWGVGVVAVAALVLGLLGRKQVQGSGGAMKGEQLAVAAIALGALGLLASVVYWILILTGVVDTTFDVNPT